jgi:hypothetical protein
MVVNDAPRIINLGPRVALQIMVSPKLHCYEASRVVNYNHNHVYSTGHILYGHILFHAKVFFLRMSCGVHYKQNLLMAQ